MGNENVALTKSSWLVSLHSQIKYTEKHDMHMLETCEYLRKATGENDLQEVKRLTLELVEQCREISLSSHSTFNSIITELTASEKGRLPLTTIVSMAALAANEKYSIWKCRKSTQDEPTSLSAPSANKEDGVSTFIALEGETNAKTAGAGASCITAEVVLSEQKVPDNGGESHPVVELAENATMRSVEASCSAFNDQNDNEDKTTEKKWFK